MNEDLFRINQPRVEKIHAMLQLIDKSAKSLRASEHDLQCLLNPVHERVNDTIYGDTTVEDEPDPYPPTLAGRLPEVTQPIANEISVLGDLTTQQLVDRMIACGAELAARRK